MEKHYGKERRKYKRIKVCFEVLCRIVAPWEVAKDFENKLIKAKTEDLAEGGVSLITSQYIPHKTKLLVKFLVFGRDSSGQLKVDEVVKFYGQVAYVMPIENCQYKIGISFGAVTRKKQGLFFDLICAPYI